MARLFIVIETSHGQGYRSEVVKIAPFIVESD
jgi:hypothetical protein